MARGKSTSRSGKAPRKRKSPKASSKKVAVAIENEERVEMTSAHEPDSEAALVLPEALDSESAGSIKEQFLAHRGSSLIVDAGHVRRTGVQAIQVLIAAARSWQADGQSYVVTNPTPEFLDTLALVGLSREQLLVEGSSL